MISNAGHDENGKLHGGKAGDQTGTEYRVIKWYSRPWSHVIRPKTREIGNMIADVAKAAANNNKIGYDQYQRKTYYNALKAAKWYPEKIKSAVECDCSASTIANVIAAGHRLGIKALTNLSPDAYTGNIRSVLMASKCFITLTDKKYLDSDKYLLPGDILLYENHHVAINLTKGSKATMATTTSSSTAKSTKKSYSGSFPKIPDKGFIGKGDKGDNVKALQRFLNWYDNYKLTVDGVVGIRTVSAIKKFQKAEKIKVDGQFGANSLKAAKAVKK